MNRRKRPKPACAWTARLTGSKPAVARWPQPGPDAVTGPDTIPSTDTLIVTVPIPRHRFPDAAAEVFVPVDVQPDADEGDVPSVLNGTCLYNGKPARTGTVCRLATDVCDVSETCDGISTACPLDKFVCCHRSLSPTAGAAMWQSIAPALPQPAGRQASGQERRVSASGDRRLRRR